MTPSIFRFSYKEYRERGELILKAYFESADNYQ